MRKYSTRLPSKLHMPTRETKMINEDPQLEKQANKNPSRDYGDHC